MTSKPSKGRSGNESERAHARMWVELYRKAQLAPDGRYCVNPEAPHEEQDFISADDPELLLQLLECFANTGKFIPKDTLNVEGMIYRNEITKLRNDRRVHGGAVQAVADKFNVEKRKVERLIRKVSDKK